MYDWAPMSSDWRQADEDDLLRQAREALRDAERAARESDARALRRATDAFDAALVDLPDRADLMAHLAELRLSLGDFVLAADAIERLEVVLEDEDPERVPAARVARAGAVADAGNPAEGLALLGPLARAHAAYEPQYCLRLRLQAFLGRHDDADETYYLARTFTDVCPACDLAAAASLRLRGEAARALPLLSRHLPPTRVPAAPMGAIAGGPGWARRDAARPDPDFPATSVPAVPPPARQLALGTLLAPPPRPPEAALRLELARCLGDLGHAAEAADQYRLALGLDAHRCGDLHAESPGAARAAVLRRYSECALRAGRHAELAAVLRREFCDHGDGAGLHLQFARALLGPAGHVPDADACTDAVHYAGVALLHDPHEAAAHVLIARALLALGRPNVARRHLRRAAERPPADFDDLRLLAHLADRVPSPRVARVALESLTLLHPDRFEGWHDLAVLYFRKRRTSEGLLAARQALSLAPDHADTHHNIALALLRAGPAHHEAALAHARAARSPSLIWRVQMRRVLSRLLTRKA